MPKYTDEIEKQANLLLESTLQNLFRVAGFKLRTQEQFKEKGIDFTLEIETRDLIPKTLGFVNLQNKGSESEITPLNKGPQKGLISFQIDNTRLIEYWCRQLDRPFIFTLCDLTKNTIYWYALQLDTDQYLEKADEIENAFLKGKRKSKTIQIYLNPNNTLTCNDNPCHDKFQDFYSQIEASQRLISERSTYQFNYERMDMFTEIKVDRNLHILDQVHTYLHKRFQFINVLPHGFWALSYPFKANKSPYFEYDQFSLYTDNKHLFELFEAFKVEDERRIVILNQEFFQGASKIEEKLLFILNVLNQNLVFNIALQSRKEQISVKIQQNDSTTEAEFGFYNLRFDKVIQQLNKIPKEEKEKNDLAFLQYEIGNYNKAARLYLELLGKTSNLHKSTKYFFYAYNLSKLEVFVRYRFSNESPDADLLKKLKEVKATFESSQVLFDGDVLITKWLKQRLFFGEFQSDIQENCENLRDFYYMLQNGGLGTNSYVWSIYVDHAFMINFMEGNKIVCDFHAEYRHLNEHVVESFLMSYSIDEAMVSRLEHFDDWHVKFIILYCKGETLQKFINRYHIQSMKYARNSIGNDSFMDLCRNFFGSAQTFLTKEEWNDSWQFNDKIRNILGTLLVLASYLDLKKEENFEIGQLIRKFLDVPILIKYPLELKFIYKFLNRKGKHIGDSQFTDFFNLIFQSSEFHNEEFLSSLSHVSEETGWFIELDESRLNNILSYFDKECLLCSSSHEPIILIYIYRLIKNEQYREIIKEKIINKLEEKYDWRLYYMAAIYHILPTDSTYFEKFIDIKKPMEGVRIFGSHYFKEHRNRDNRLGAIINLCLKFKIDLTSSRFNHFRGFDPYYDWLMDMENFDYSKFEARWITEYATTFYMRGMSGVKVIIKLVLDHLDAHYDQLIIRHLLMILRNTDDYDPNC